MEENPRRPSLVLFDFDGTLVDTEAVDSVILSRRLTEAGIACTAQTVLRRFAGLARSEVPVFVRDHMGAELPAQWQRDYLAEMHEAELRAPVIAGAAEFFSFLRGQGIRAGLATNSRGPRIARMLEATGLGDFFRDSVYHLGLGCRMKPEPDIFLYGARSQGALPRDTWVVEDSPLGIVAGRRAGMPCVGLTAFNRLGAERERELLEAGAFALAPSLAALRALIEQAEDPAQ